MISRRDLLRRAALGPFGLLTLGAAEQTPGGIPSQSFQLKAQEATPDHPAHPSHGSVPPGTEVAEEQLARALAARSGPLRGLDPTAFLRRFEAGTLSRSGGQAVREFRLVAQEVRIEVAPGIEYPAWTYNDTVPGPTLRAKEGDRVRVHFENRSQTDHTVHFHGVHPANMDGVVEIVAPGGSYVYEFEARPAGLQLYHCHVVPTDLHMARGLFGAFVIDPARGRSEADEMVLISHGWDLDFDGRNELYALNGGVNFYRDNPVELASGAPVRIYLVNALEYEPVCSFHVHANFFRLNRTGQDSSPWEQADLVCLAQAERAILELSYPWPGTFMFHPHQNRFAERGAMGHFRVRG